MTDEMRQLAIDHARACREFGPEVILVCGGRDFDDYALLRDVLEQLKPQMILHGGCPTGADPMASSWADSNAVHVAVVRALWDKHGRAAGPLRNAAMLRLCPDMVVAFAGGKGTADMVKKARAEGIHTLEL